MTIIKDIMEILKSLSFLDYVLYFSVLILLILVISLLYVIKTENDEDLSLFKEDEDLDLKEIVKKIDNNPKSIIDMTQYESEQEERAIISYDELKNSAKKQVLNYTDREIIDDVAVKKVDLLSIQNNEEQENFAENVTEWPPKVDIKLMHYEHEEAFLKALKELNELLN